MTEQTRIMVKSALTDYPELRDSDAKLIAILWTVELSESGYALSNLPTQKFMQILADGKLTSSETITRVRRRLQEQYPELRGAKYNQRQANQEKVKKDLGYGQ
jgi:hypothetical protein